MRVVVTGGSGKAGRWVVKRLAEAGYEVRNVDVAPPVKPRSLRDKLLPLGEGIEVPFLRADLTDYGQTVDALKGSDAVVHLAAIPAPRIATDEVTFRTNVTSTWNVFSAAVTLGMKRVVWASSETVLGLPFERVRPDYAPIDEACTRFPETAYALSKLTGEDMAKEFARWSLGASTLRQAQGAQRRRSAHAEPVEAAQIGIPFIGLRFSNIIEPGDYDRFASWQDDPHARKWNMWGYVDARDCGLSCQRALEADTSSWAMSGPVDSGSAGLAQSFIIAAADTVMHRPSKALLAEVFPTVPVKGKLSRNGTLLAIEKARRMLGYEPEHSWKSETTPKPDRGRKRSG